MSNYRQVEKKTNSRGVDYQLARDISNNTFSVWRKCENYCRHAKGGIAVSWRYVDKNMTRDDAQVLFKRRSK
ncbi:hypothetical protein IBT49_04545 [Erwinia sp. S63]|uniref:hypothetical protein n=1 Tax=Erwinia sp. S63 TaxID=2769341 RepID=UPI00190A2792|nr:hypothetical protein [Erwinia sp. S63]MBK0095233.1 hypothetical protein [Erwinia sp. S63]